MARLLKSTTYSVTMKPLMNLIYTSIQYHNTKNTAQNTTVLGLILWKKNYASYLAKLET